MSDQKMRLKRKQATQLADYIRNLAGEDHYIDMTCPEIAVHATEALSFPVSPLSVGPICRDWDIKTKGKGGGSEHKKLAELERRIELLEVKCGIS